MSQYAEETASSADRIGELHRKRLLGILSGTWTAQACYVLAKLGLPDRMATGPCSVDDLATWAGADPAALRRLLGGLAAAGLLREPAPNTFALTPVTDLLRSQAPGSIRATAILYGEEVFGAFGEILQTVRTGAPAFVARHGQPFYDYLSGRPQLAEAFHTAMGSQPAPSTLAGIGLDGIGTIVDIGGGDGGLLASLLERQPATRGILVELPEAASQARRRLASLGVLDRVRIVEGSFFDTVPGDGDLYILCRVLHNWTDRNALHILRQLHRHMPPGARLVVAEALLADPGGDDRPGRTLGRSRLVDLLMLVMLEGRDRTAAEYCNLLARAGFRVVRTDDTGPAEGIVEALR